MLNHIACGASPLGSVARHNTYWHKDGSEIPKGAPSKRFEAQLARFEEVWDAIAKIVTGKSLKDARSEVGDEELPVQEEQEQASFAALRNRRESRPPEMDGLFSLGN